MGFRHIGLIGKARAGKDSAAAALVATHSYTRLAFADALRTAALRVNPVISNIPNFYSDGSSEPVSLHEVVTADGWDSAKQEYPEIRRFLQHFGSAVRDIDPEFWLRPVLSQLDGGSRLGMPCVITDVRYRNEADALRAAGVLLVRVLRPDSADALSGSAAAHASETELDGFAADMAVTNDGTLDEFRAKILGIASIYRTP